MIAFDSRFESIRSIWTRSKSPGQRARLVDEPQRHFPAFGWNLELIDNVSDHFDQIERLLLQDHLTRFGLRKEQQSADDLGEAFDIGERVHDGVAVLIHGLSGEQGDFQLAPHDGNGGSQLVRNIGRKLPHLIEIDLDALDHLIERLDQAVEFVAGAAYRNAEAQVRTADALSGFRDFKNRGQSASGEDPANHDTGQNDQRQEYQTLQCEAVEDASRVGERGADGDIEFLRGILLTIDITGSDQIVNAMGVGSLGPDRLR